MPDVKDADLRVLLPQHHEGRVQELDGFRNVIPPQHVDNLQTARAITSGKLFSNSYLFEKQGEMNWVKMFLRFFRIFHTQIKQ